ncbi:MAG: hypothetical protein C0505_20305 [Leptothrix sp. (in: Bacteria)]|nr:hypothetical protein [Leptothrix sp. (in: b-proteobacteria)]
MPPQALAEEALPSSPAALTLRDPPTPAPGDTRWAEGHELFPGTDGLVGHEPPLPRQPGGWTEDLTALHAMPLPVVPPAASAGPVEPALPAAPALPAPLPPAARPAPPVLREWAVAPEARPAPESPPRRPRLLGPQPSAAARATPSLPAAAAARPAPLPIKPSKPAKVPKATLLPSAPRALLVDDSAIALLFLEKRLEQWHVHTDQAPNSQAALALLAQQSYDLVFLDVELGPNSELDGLALCRQIKQTPSSMNALVVMVSAHHTELDRVRGSLAGCDAYLAKPLDGTELQRLLQRQGLNPRAEAGTVPS